MTLSPPLLDAARPGRTGTGQLSRAMLEGDIDLEGLSPKEAPSAREYPGAAAGSGARDPERGGVGVGTPGDSRFPGTERRTRGRRRQGPRCPVAGPAPCCSLVRGGGGGLGRRRQVTGVSHGQTDGRQMDHRGPGRAGGGHLPGRPRVPVPGEHLPAVRHPRPGGWKLFGCFYRRY